MHFDKHNHDVFNYHLTTKPSVKSLTKNERKQTKLKTINQGSTHNEIHNTIEKKTYVHDFLVSLTKYLINGDKIIYLIQTLWLLGFVILIIKLVSARLLIYGIYKNSDELDNYDWNSIYLEIKDYYNLSRQVKILENDEIRSPMTWGILWPKIIVPTASQNWSEEEKRYVLLHEFAHIKRMDLIFQFVANLVCTIQWFNPLAWFSYKRMINECEHACDNYVVNQCNSPSNYAELLVKIASSSFDENYESTDALMMAKKTFLEKRLLSVLNKKRSRSKITFFGRCTIIIGVSIISLPLLIISPPISNSKGLINYPIYTKKITTNNQNLISNIKNNKHFKNNTIVDTSDTSTVVALTRLLYDEDDDVKLQAVETLGKIGSKMAINNILASLKKNEWQDLDDIVQILGTLKSTFPIHFLMDSIVQENSKTRLRAIKSLNDAPNENALVPLCKYMNDKNSKIRFEAARGLSRIGVHDAALCLTNHFNDNDEDVRIKVVEALGNIQDERAVPYLVKALGDDSYSVRKKAAWALGAIKDSTVVKQLANSLKNDENWEVRLKAAEALGKIKVKSAIGPLTEALNKEDKNEVRKEIVEALGDIFEKQY